MNKWKYKELEVKTDPDLFISATGIRSVKAPVTPQDKGLINYSDVLQPNQLTINTVNPQPESTTAQKYFLL